MPQADRVDDPGVLMPHGGQVEEVPPAACPANHRWGPPVNGTVLYTVGHRPCRCPSALAAGWHGHRRYHCERPGCGLEILRPECDGPTYNRAVHTG